MKSLKKSFKIYIYVLKAWQITSNSNSYLLLMTQRFVFDMQQIL